MDGFRINNGRFLETGIATRFACGPEVLIPFLARLSGSLAGNQLMFILVNSAGSGWTLRGTASPRPGTAGHGSRSETRQSWRGRIFKPPLRWLGARLHPLGEYRLTA